jgi:hypothetical protein
MRTLDERIEKARTRAERFTRWAEDASDEAKGAEACGLLERAEKCRRVAAAWTEDADVQAAAVGRLTTERKAAAVAALPDVDPATRAAVDRAIG